jgi:twinkle protein
VSGSADAALRGRPADPRQGGRGPGGGRRVRCAGPAQLRLGDNTTSGTTGAGNFSDDWLDSLEPFDSIFLCYDDDPAGQKGAADLAAKLGLYKCSKVVFPKKDAGDCRIERVPVETIHRAFKVAESYLDIRLLKANEYAVDLRTLLERPETLKGVSTGSEVMDTAIGGWANGMVVVTGESGNGKTTWTTWALWKLAHAGHAVAITSFEQQPIMTVLQLLSMEMGGDPTERTREEREAALDRLSELPLYIVDHYGQLPWTKLEEALKYAVRRCGVRYVLVDHLGFLIDPDADDERRAIQAVIRSMVLLRKDMDVTLFLIVHPRNDPDASKKFGRVTMQHLKGASAIRQDADLVLVVTRELPNTEKGRMLPKTKRRPWPQTRIYIDKKRGRFGAVSGAGEVVMAFDPKSQTFADTWDQTPLGRTGELMDSAPPETQDESEQPETTKGRGGGAKRGGRGKKSNAGGSSTVDF